MQSSPGIAEIRQRIDQIAEHVTRIHRLVPMLGSPLTQNEVYKALYELTKQVEVVKKQLLKLEKGDDSAAL